MMGWQTGDQSQLFYLFNLEGRIIAPHIPVWEKSTHEDGTFSRTDFTFDNERNVYVCPHTSCSRP